MRRWPDPRTLPFDPAYGYALLGMLALLILTLLVVVVFEWRQHAHRVKAPLHTEYGMKITDEGDLVTREFDGCGCPIGVDHWQDGEPHRD